MIDARPKICCLSGNALKIIAAISMFIDHFGAIFFPRVALLRAIGRLAFPIFAYMIAEGCRYTKHRLRYFLTVALMGAGYTAVYYIYDRTLYLCILVTFALSIMMIYALELLKNELFVPERRVWRIALAALVFLASVSFTYVLNLFVKIDYGFYGCLTPVLVSIFLPPRENAPAFYDTVGKLRLELLGLAIGIAALYIAYGGIRYYAFLAIPLVFLYSGKRGKHKMKYFFYIFYPAHLLALEGLAMLMAFLK